MVIAFADRGFRHAAAEGKIGVEAVAVIGERDIAENRIPGGGIRQGNGEFARLAVGFGSVAGDFEVRDLEHIPEMFAGEGDLAGSLADLEADFLPSEESDLQRIAGHGQAEGHFLSERGPVGRYFLGLFHREIIQSRGAVFHLDLIRFFRIQEPHKLSAASSGVVAETDHEPEMFRGGIIDFDAEIDLAVGGIGDDGQEFVAGGKQFHATVAAGNGGHVGHVGVLFHIPPAGQAVRGRSESFGIKRTEFFIVLFHAGSSGNVYSTENYTPFPSFCKEEKLFLRHKMLKNNIAFPITAHTPKIFRFCG